MRPTITLSTRGLEAAIASLDPRSYERRIDAALDQAAKQAQELLDRPARTWTRANRPSWRVKKGRASRDIITTDTPYLWTDLGTRPHTIRAKTAAGLVFRGPYSPKTRPGSLAAGRSSRGDRYTRTMAVNHPGTAARGFSKQVAVRMQRPIERLMRYAMTRA